MHRSRVVFLLMVLSFFRSFAQEDSGVPQMTDEERAARRAQFVQLMQGRLGGGGGGAPIDQAVSTQRPAEAAQLETTQQPAQTGSEVTVNWENVTLKDCIEVLCRDLGMEFVISPSVNVSQEVSVRAGDVTKWNVTDKQELFDAILETAGVQRVQRGRVWVFSPSDIRPVVEAFADSKYGDGKPVIGVIKLKSIDASQAEQFLNTVGGKPPRVFAMKGSRMVLVLGTQQFLSQMEELVKLIDFSPGVVTPYVLEYASSDDIAKELAAIFYGRTGGDGESLRFISISRLNTVVAHNVSESMMDEVTKWVEMLDRFDDQNDRVTRVYRLQVIDAETIGKTLDSLYSTLYKQTQSAKKQASSSTAIAKGVKSSNGGAAKQTAGNAAAKTGAAAAAPKADSAPAKASGNGGSQASPDMEEEAVILADKDTNTLIINATPDQHRDIERTIKELDRPRRQVLIETVLVEVTLDEGMDLGVEWALSKGISIQGSVEQSFNRGNTPANNDGFSYLLSSSADKLAFIQAAQNDNRLQVLSSPTVLTRDGMEATVSFGQEVPIQEKSTSGTSSTRDNYSYSYQDAKITLTVTPVIDDNKMVTLNLTQTLRQIPSDYTVQISGDNDVVLPPIFTTRELSSSLQVDNGQTLVLGGLIQREDQKVRRGIPLISRIPGIGWLFGWNSTIKKGSEILMILTPRVVDSREDTDSLTREFREKILGAMSEKNIRQLYNLEEPKKTAEPKVEVTVPEAEGN
jgi:general secretion pathway protein D